LLFNKTPLSKQSLEEFKEIYKKVSGEEISDQEDYKISKQAFAVV